jgi:hypothetical protein
MPVEVSVAFVACHIEHTSLYVEWSTILPVTRLGLSNMAFTQNGHSCQYPMAHFYDLIETVRTILTILWIQMMIWLASIPHPITSWASPI